MVLSSTRIRSTATTLTTLMTTILRSKSSRTMMTLIMLALRMKIRRSKALRTPRSPSRKTTKILGHIPVRNRTRLRSPAMR